MTTTTKPKKRRTPPPPEWHAKLLPAMPRYYNRTVWECKYCHDTFSCYGTQHGAIRQHLRRVHPKQYAKVPSKMYFIEEDAV